jgi:Rod binding domain-containing protein
MSTLSAITATAIAGSNSAANQTPSATPQPRLVKAAHEFEAQMMKELLEPLNHSTSLLGADGDDDSGDSSGSAGALGEFASEALGKALSEGGGFGIATSIVKQLSKTGDPGKSSGQVTKTVQHR